MNLREDFKALCEEGEPLLILDEDDFVQLITDYIEIVFKLKIQPTDEKTSCKE